VAGGSASAGLAAPVTTVLLPLPPVVCWCNSVNSIMVACRCSGEGKPMEDLLGVTGESGGTFVVQLGGTRPQGLIYMLCSGTCPRSWSPMVFVLLRYEEKHLSGVLLFWPNFDKPLPLFLWFSPVCNVTLILNHCIYD
ncbi:unnamed protein product, partial [Ixodes pacificus]